MQNSINSVIETLKQGFVYPQDKDIYTSIYRAIKESDGLYSRFEIENLIKKDFIKIDTNHQVYLPDILFYTFLRKNQNALFSSGILKKPKRDTRNYDTLTEQQAEQLFVVFGSFVEKLSIDKRKELLSL